MNETIPAAVRKLADQIVEVSRSADSASEAEASVIALLTADRATRPSSEALQRARGEEPKTFEELIHRHKALYNAWVSQALDEMSARTGVRIATDRAALRGEERS